MLAHRRPAQLDGNNIPPLADILHDLTGDEDVDLLIRSPGVIDTAEKVVSTLRKRCRGFRVIVPEPAKSAATLIALAADEIVMGYASELGPIDPQVPVPLPNGNWDLRPAHSILDGLEETKREADDAGGQLSSAYLPLLQYLDPALLDVCRQVIRRSRALAETWLEQFQCPGEPEKAASIAERLEDPSRHLSHGALIDATQARDRGLNVIELAPDDALGSNLEVVRRPLRRDSSRRARAAVRESICISVVLTRRVQARSAETRISRAARLFGCLLA